MKVLVAGSTGYLGQHVVRELHTRGHLVRALVRSPAKLEPLRDAVDELYRADATDPTARLVLLRRLTPLRTHQLLEFPLTVLTQDVIAPTTGRRRLAEHFDQLVSDDPQQ